MHFFIICFIGISFISVAQHKNTSEYSGFFDTYYFRGPWNFSLGGGMAGYSGDLGFSLGNSIAANGSYKLWPRTYFGGQLNYLNFNLTKDKESKRAITCRSKIYEVYGFVRFNIIDKKLLKHQQINQKEMFIRPYLLTGLGLGLLNAISKTDSLKWSKDSIPEKGSNPRLLPVVPLGVGFSIFITHRISILVEFDYRIPFTDYIDDVRARGDEKKDAYFSANIKLQYSPLAPKMKKKMKFKSNPEPGPPPPPRPPKQENTENKNQGNENQDIEQQEPLQPEEEKPKQEENFDWFNR
jgi:hypothetical protein